MFSIYSQYLKLTSFQLQKCLLFSPLFKIAFSVLFLLLFYFLFPLFCTSFFLLLFKFGSIWGQSLLICNNWFCCFHITPNLVAASSFPVATCLLIILAGTRDTGLFVAPLCSTSSSPPGPTTAPPGLPPLLNVVIATDSQWAQETPCWAKTGRKRHWAASAGADKAKMLGWSPLVRKRERNIEIILALVDLPAIFSDLMEWLEGLLKGPDWVT